MSARAVVDTDYETLRLTLVEAPDQEQSTDARPFIAERARVEIDHRTGTAYVTVEGRAILTNGDIGRVMRWRPYDLSGLGRVWDEAPEWLSRALQDAGVTW